MSAASEAEIVSFSPFTITEICNDIIMKLHYSVSMKHHPNSVHSVI